MIPSIIISDIKRATTILVEPIRETDYDLLAGDIENFLQTKKSMICKIKVKEVD